MREILCKTYTTVNEQLTAMDLIQQDIKSGLLPGIQKIERYADNDTDYTLAFKISFSPDNTNKGLFTDEYTAIYYGQKSNNFIINVSGYATEDLIILINGTAYQKILRARYKTPYGINLFDISDLISIVENQQYFDYTSENISALTNHKINVIDFRGFDIKDGQGEGTEEEEYGPQIKEIERILNCQSRVYFAYKNARERNHSLMTGLPNYSFHFRKEIPFQIQMPRRTKEYTQPQQGDNQSGLNLYENGTNDQLDYDPNASNRAQKITEMNKARHSLAGHLRPLLIPNSTPRQFYWSGFLNNVMRSGAHPDRHTNGKDPDMYKIRAGSLYSIFDFVNNYANFYAYYCVVEDRTYRYDVSGTEGKLTFITNINQRPYERFIGEINTFNWTLKPQSARIKYFKPVFYTFSDATIGELILLYPTTVSLKGKIDFYDASLHTITSKRITTNMQQQEYSRSNQGDIPSNTVYCSITPDEQSNEVYGYKKSNSRDCFTSIKKPI